MKLHAVALTEAGSDAEPRATGRKAIGSMLRCQHKGCGENLAEIHFTASTGVVSILKCPKCGSRNDFVNTPGGIVAVE